MSQLVDINEPDTVDAQPLPEADGLYYAVVSQPSNPSQQHRVLGKWYRDTHGQNNLTKLYSAVQMSERQQELENWLGAVVKLAYVGDKTRHKRLDPIPTKEGLYYAILEKSPLDKFKGRVMGKWYRDFHGEGIGGDLKDRSFLIQRKVDIRNWMKIVNVRVIYVDKHIIGHELPNADPYPKTKGLYYAILDIPTNDGFEGRTLGKWYRDSHGEQNNTDLGSFKTQYKRRGELSKWTGAGDIRAVYVDDNLNPIEAKASPFDLDNLVFKNVHIFYIGVGLITAGLSLFVI